jgi:hypothetical protein
MKRIAIALLFLISIYPLVAQGIQYKEQIEPISGFSISIEKITFTVWDSGYTDKSSFRLDIQKVDNITYKVSLIRIKPDYGKMVEQPCEIVYTQDELKGKIDLRNTVYLVNPFSNYRE